MNRTQSLMFQAVLTTSLVLGVDCAYAAGGSLDSTFGQGGKVVTTFADQAAPFQSVVGTDAAQQFDGKIVVATGFSNSLIATEALGVVRYLPNGNLDTAFGTGGGAQTAFTNFINSPTSIAIQADGKIVVVGTASSADGTLSEFAIARFNTNGTLDTTFGNGGQVTTNFNGVMVGGVSNPANAVLIQPADGKILVGGGASLCGRCVKHTALARYNTDGSLDGTFGNGGTVNVVAIGAVTALGLDAAGNIFALNRSAIAEFSPSGVLDSTITPAAITASSHGFFGPSAFQPDGRYLVAEGVPDGSPRDTDTQVVRFFQTGTIDSSFNSPEFDFTGGSAARDVATATALQLNGQVVVGGTHFMGGVSLFGLARLNANGSLDSTFGTGGILSTSFPNQTSASLTTIVIQSDGKIVAVGQTLTSSGIANLALARYLPQ